MTTQLSETRRKVKELTELGHSPREIAQLVNVSTQRVYQHLKKLGMDPAPSREPQPHEESA